MRKVLTKLAVAAATLVGAVSSAQAYVILTITDQTAAVSITCASNAVCGAGFTINGINEISFAGSVGAFDINTTNGLASSDPNFATIDTTNSQVRRTGGVGVTNNLLISFTYMDISLPPDTEKSLSGSGSQTSGIGLTGNEVLLTRVAVNSDNLNTFFPPLVGTAGAITAMSCSFAIAASGSCDATSDGTPTGATKVTWADPIIGNPMYSMNSQQRFTMGLGARVNTTSSAVVGRLPEPMTVALVGMALCGLALTTRRRTGKQA